MAKFDFAALAATVRGIIDKFGEDVTIERRLPASEDPDKPWEPPGMDSTSVVVPGVWSKDSSVRGESVALEADAYVILASGFAPDAATDRVIRADGRKYQVMSVEIVDPGGVAVIYELAVKV